MKERKLKCAWFLLLGKLTNDSTLAAEFNHK